MHAQLPSTVFAEQYDTVDFGQFLGTLKRRGATIIIFTVLAASVALVHVLLSVPQFTAQGVLYLGETQDSGDAGDPAGAVNLSAYSTQSDVETQIGLLTTGTLINRAVLETGLNTTVRPAGQPPLTYWRWRAFSHGKTAVFAPRPRTLQAVNATLVGNFRIVAGPDNTYQLYDKKHLSGEKGPILTGVFGEPETVGTNAITIERAPLVQDSGSGEVAEIPVGTVYDLDVVAPDVLADSLSGGMLSVTAGGSQDQPTKLATLQLKWHDPYQAKQFVNQLMYDYISTQLQWKTEAASVTEDFVSGQIADVNQKMVRADRELALFQSQTNILDPQQNAQQTVEQLAQFESQRAAVLLQQQALQQLHDSFQSKNAHVDPYLISASNDPVLAGLATSLSDAMVKLQQVGAEYTAGSQDVYFQQTQVTELRAAIATLVENDLDQATKNLHDIDELIAAYQNKIKEQPAEALRVGELKRTSDQLGQFYELLTEKAEQAQISKASTIIATRVVTPSEMPHATTSPKATIAVIGGTLAGLFMGIIVVFLQQTLSSRYESEDQIRRMIKLPVYGKIPTQKLLGVGTDFFGPKTPNAFSESFQLIKRNLLRLAKPESGTVILVISANERDGKTTIAANLAKTYADDGKRVVMLDCDFHLSRLKKLKEFSKAPGLTDWLATGERPQLQHWPDEAFWIVPAGSPLKRGVRLDDSSFSEILDQLKSEFDYIVMDSPPLPIVSDGLVLSDLADVILSVISVKNTARRAFDYHSELLAGVGRPHGLIINGAEGENYAETDAYFLGVGKRRKRITDWFNVPAA